MLTSPPRHAVGVVDAPARAPAGWFLVALFVALIGYLIAGRSFAQVGLPAASVFIGEVLLIGMILHPATRATLEAAVRGLFVPCAWHGLLWILALFVSYGVALAARGIMAGFEPIETAKLFAFNYLPVFLFAGIALQAARPSSLPQLVRYLPWANAIYLLVFKLVLGSVPIKIPFSAVPHLTPGAGATISLALMVCYDRPITRRWYLLGLNVFLLLFLQIRGDWLAAIGAMIVWSVLLRRYRAFFGALAVAVIGLLFISASGVHIPGAAGRGGAVNVNEVAARAIAPFDEELAAELSPSAANFAGTSEWRKDWWGHIWSGVHASEERELFGYGYGFPLSDLFPQLSEEAVRSPHNIFFFTLGYGGWIGVALFAAFQLALLAKFLQLFRRTGNPIGPMLWVIALAAALFGNFYETPYNALPFYIVSGMILASVAGDLADSARRAVGLGPGAPPEPETERATT